MLATRRSSPNTIHQLLSCGIDPLDFDVLVAKGVHGPFAAYDPICPTLIRVNTEGITTADLSALPFRNRRHMYPFEPDITYSPEERRGRL